jgi:hypothetical protein
MLARCASLRFSLCGRVIRCRCLLLANATSGRDDRYRERCDGHLELPMGEERGREAIRNFFRGAPRLLSFAAHQVMNPIIDVEGDHTRAAIV